MRQNSTPERLSGLYLRGKIFWFNHGTGKNRIQLSLETSDEADAINKATAILENPELNPCNGFLKEMNRYADEKFDDGTWTGNSRKSKTSILKMFGEDLGFKDLPDIKTEDVQKWYDDQRKRVPSSVHGYMNTVRAFFKWAVGKKLLRISPAAGVKMAKHKSQARVKFCTFAQRDKCFKEAKGNNDLLFILFCGFYGGMRKNEIVEARPEWFDLEHNLVHVEETPTFTVKNKKTRSVPLHPDFKKFLEEYDMSGLYMLKPDVVKGKGLYRYDFRKPFSKFMTDAKLPWVTPHVMRHTFASLLASANVSLFKIARWLGDTLSTTEKHYAHLVPQDDAIALLSTPTVETGTRLTSKEIGQLQQKVKRYELALKELVPADDLEAYWERVKNESNDEEKRPALAKN
ncbi:MAG: site-specific integrase [Negativicutes bacterium]|nr:site-specific integrase [Negativicutes bacterium]